jgi:ribulose-phosphate 3-epimerase
MLTIIPSILTDNPEELQKKLSLIQGHSQSAHLDVMDGDYVSSKSVTLAEIAHLSGNLEKPPSLEVHLMVNDPRSKLSEVIKIPGIKSVILQADSTADIKGDVELYKKHSLLVGVCFPLDFRDDIHFSMDFSLVLSEEDPGFGGSGFNPDSLSLIEFLREEHPKLTVEVDGGMNAITIKQCMKDGVRRFVVNSDIFKNNDPLKELSILEHLDESE